MRKKNKYKLMLAVVFLAGVAAAGAYFLFMPPGNENKTANIFPDSLFGWKYPVAKFPSTGSADRIAYSDIRDPGGLPQGLPVRLKVPVIGVDTAIEDALITADGRMDVPAGSVNVAWFSLGPHPGQTGSAVIGGHYGISNGKPFVFYNLDKLKIGDKIYIIDDKNATLAFVVRSIKSFDRNADATPVFTSSDGLAHLNLITCEGIWNRVNDTYPQRLVVFTDAIPAEGKVPSSSLPVKSAALPQIDGSISVSPPLNLGARGADVAFLQTVLVQKGFLKMPLGVAKGFFGILTRRAVTKYQASAGLPASGIFNQPTRDKLLAAKTVAPTLPTTAVEMSQVTMAPASQTFTQAIKNLYATPLDGLITFCLIFAILFLVFKIIKR